MLGSLICINALDCIMWLYVLYLKQLYCSCQTNVVQIETFSVWLWFVVWVWAGHLFFQGGHPLLQMELQPLVGLREQLVHRVGETLVVFIVHPLPLPRLRGRERDGWERRRRKTLSVRKGGGGRGELGTSILLDWEWEAKISIWMCTVK